MRLLHTRQGDHIGVPHGCTFTRRSHWQPVQVRIVGTETAVVVVEGRGQAGGGGGGGTRFSNTGADMIGPRQELRARVESNTGQVTVDYADGQRLPVLRH